MVWSEDGSQLYIQLEVNSLEVYETYWTALDLESGALQPPEADPRVPEPAAWVYHKSGWAYQPSGWGEILLLSPAGETRSFGEGLPLAWAADGRLWLVRK